MSSDVITKATLLPIGLVAALVVLVWQGSARITTVEAKQVAHSDAIHAIETDRAEAKKAYLDHLIKIETSIAELRAEVQTSLRQRR